MMIIKDTSQKRSNQMLNGDLGKNSVAQRLFKSFGESAHDNSLSLRLSLSLSLAYKHTSTTEATEWYWNLFRNDLQLKWQGRKNTHKGDQTFYPLNQVQWVQVLVELRGGRDPWGIMSVRLQEDRTRVVGIKSRIQIGHGHWKKNSQHRSFGMWWRLKFFVEATST